MVWQQAAEDSRRVLLRRLNQLDSFFLQALGSEIQRDAPPANHHATCIFSREPVVLVGKEWCVVTISKREKKILICRAWFPAEATTEYVKAVLKRIKRRDSRRISTKRFKNHQPVGVVAIDVHTNIRWIDVAIVQHRENETPGALIKLLENLFSSVHCQLGYMFLLCSAIPA